MESGEETICLTFSKEYTDRMFVLLLGIEVLPEYASTYKFRIGTTIKKKKNVTKNIFCLFVCL